jgi:S-adenosylmethionine decarboxylase
MDNLHHVVFDCYGCEQALLDDEERIASILVSAAELANMRVIGKISHKFTPQGITVVLLLAESHIAIHTWPEARFAAIDLFSCKPFQADRVHQALVSDLRAKSSSLRELRRGI